MTVNIYSFVLEGCFSTQKVNSHRAIHLEVFTVESFHMFFNVAN